MSDIVFELKREAKLRGLFLDEDQQDDTATLCLEAATTIDQLRKRVEALQSWVDIYKTGYEKASEFIRLHPGDPDITREQTEAWLALLAWREAAEAQGLAQQGGEQE